MLLSHCDIDSVFTKAENLRISIEKCKPNDLTITSSIGVAAMAKDDNFESLFDKANFNNVV